ncbi:hypothetical protein KBD61_05005 [Patescibacteria group bacterium]|nr:hypothetical protein [Patescibacteria group bacterium]MBP9710349.1 hypothetical protein [Patescibacteria group bacterium]
MSLTFYVAGSLDKGNQLKETVTLLEEKGHTISFDWTIHPVLKPYQEHLDQTPLFAQKALNGANECDIFLLFPDEVGGVGQFVELGAAIFSKRVHSIFIIGPHNQRSLMFFHPRVQRVDSLDDVLKTI